MKCAVCATPLTGKLDTYDDPDAPLCRGCWFATTARGLEEQRALEAISAAFWQDTAALEATKPGEEPPHA